ncbi:MAG: SRPBCC family protein [Actinomycetes bacterium]
MARTSGHVAAPPEAVWAELADGWGYATWVVGTIKIRSVDPEWPAVGSKLHHAVGAWPLELKDESQVQECEPGRRLVMVARGWPFGEATVDITVTPAGAGTRLEIAEEPVSGPGAWLQNPLVDAVGKRRLDEMVQRLTRLVEGHHRDRVPE